MGGEFYFQFHINRECNLRCAHCYQTDYAPSEASLSDLLEIGGRILQAAKRWNVKARVALSGGEPFLSHATWPMLDIFEQSEDVSLITVLSNGTLIDSAVASRLSDYGKLREVQVSLDGASSEGHDFIRGRGSFDRALEGIDALKIAGVNVAVMFTLSRFNKHSVMEMLDLCQRKRVDYVSVERVVPRGPDPLAQELVSSEELKRIYCDIHNWAESQDSTSHRVNVRRTRSLWALVSEYRGGFCPIGLSSLCILDDGTILPCRRLQIPIGNVHVDRGLFRAWYTSDLLWRVRMKRDLSPTCKNCLNLCRCGGCRAIAYATTGDYMGGDPQCWLNSETS